MTQLPTAGGLIDVARKLLDVLDMEVKTADAIREGDKRFKVLAPMDLQNITRSAIATRLWRHQGRQVLAMHPAVVDEVAVSSSDKIPGEVLRTLPYLCPMVLYAVPPVFTSWVQEKAAEDWRDERWRGETYHSEEHSMRLLGFLTYSHGPVRDEQWAAERSLPDGQMLSTPKRPMYEVFEDCSYTTHDPQGTTFGIVAMFEVLDAAGNRLDYETNTLSIPFDKTATLRETVDVLLQRFQFTTRDGDTPQARTWMRQVMSTIVGTLFYLCSTTLEAEAIPRKQLAALGGGRKPPAIYKVGWRMGAALTKLAQQRREGGAATNESQEPQHRRGHFKMQPYGPRSSLRKVVYISPYWTHAELLTEQGTNTMRRVPMDGPRGSARESMQTALKLRP